MYHGKIIGEYIYDAWGNCEVNILNDTNPNDIDKVVINYNPFSYKGYYCDLETQMYYCNTRYYDSSVGRWISADDSSYLDPETIGGINLCSYCGNNPLMGYDPEGTWNRKKFWKGVLLTAVIIAVAVVIAVSLGATAGAVVAYEVAAGPGGIAGTVITAAFQDEHYARLDKTLDFPSEIDINDFEKFKNKNKDKYIFDVASNCH